MTQRHKFRKSMNRAVGPAIAVIAVLASAAGIASWTDGLVLGLLLWLGFAAAIGLTAWVASDRPLGGYAIDWGYQLVFLPMMGAIIGTTALLGIKIDPDLPIHKAVPRDRLVDGDV